MFIELRELRSNVAIRRHLPGSKGQNAVHACMIRLLNLGPAKHEEVAIYVVNQRIPNVYRIAGVAKQRSNSQASVGVKYLLTPTSFLYMYRKLYHNLAENTSCIENVSHMFLTFNLIIFPTVIFILNVLVFLLVNITRKEMTINGFIKNIKMVHRHSAIVYVSHRMTDGLKKLSVHTQFVAAKFITVVRQVLSDTWAAFSL